MPEKTVKHRLQNCEAALRLRRRADLLARRQAGRGAQALHSRRNVSKAQCNLLLPREPQKKVAQLASGKTLQTAVAEEELSRAARTLLGTQLAPVRTPRSLTQTFMRARSGMTGLHGSEPKALPLTRR